MTACSCFCFLGEQHRVAAPEAWNDTAREKLWLYNLHYFDDLNAEGAEARVDWHETLLNRWVRENPPGMGTGWEPYPTSLRIVNWIKWTLAGHALTADCIHSLAVQARWLSKRFEYHLLGNHLFANAKAMVFAGSFFCGPEADAWLEAGLRILAQQVPEQILKDGGQFERSTMYHALALEDMEDLCNVAGAFSDAVPEKRRMPVSRWSEVVCRMRHWLAVMCHPDGEISFFNDSAIGISPSPAELEAYARRLRFSALAQLSDGVTHLTESGYIRIQLGAVVALLDVAPVGPDYLPGHAHADTLSFELSLFGRRVLVNSGTSRYGVGYERLRQRGTAAHNTVVLDGQDSSEVWAGFRVARRAKPLISGIERQGQHLIIDAGHDGYRRLSGKNTHQRRWTWGEGSVAIEDTISGPFERAEARFHLHPDVVIGERWIDEGRLVLLLSGGGKLVFTVEGGTLRVEPSTWHPHFGVSVPNTCLAVCFLSSAVRTVMRWEERT